MKETSLFLPIKAYLVSQGYEVYSEVLVRESSRYIDIVAIKSDEILTVELKTSYSQELIKQGLFNSQLFHKSYVAIPKPKKNGQIKLQNQVGVIFVDINNNDIEIVHHPKSAPFLPSIEKMKSRLFLNSINKIILAGEEITKNHLTAKQITLAKIKNMLLTTSLPLDEVISKLDSHYKNNESTIALIRESEDLIITEENGLKIVSLK